MHFGTYMGIYWILKFILFPLGFHIPFLSLLFVILTLSVPFIGYHYAKMYRDKICGGSIQFSHAMLFTIFMYMFASLLVEKMDISVVIPLFNEEESLPELYAWIERVMQANGFSFEVIFVNDGSTDHSWEVIEKFKAQSEHVKGIKFRRNYGKSPALYCGFAEAEGNVVITMDADLQDSPDEIPELYRMITKDGYDLVSGWKQKRYDPISKTLPTKLFNATARKVSGIKNLHDFNCGLKAYRKEVVKHIEVYGEMHRYIPYLAKNAGFKKIGEKVVHHQARKYGTTKFGLNRFVNGYLDLLSLWFLSRFGIKPMHFFGLLGSLMFLIGMISVIIVGASKLYAMYNGLPYRLVTDSPYFYLSLTAMIIGTQLFLAGFLGELISRNAPERNNHYDTQVTLLCSYSDTIPNVEKKILTHYTLYNKILLISSPWNVVI